MRKVKLTMLAATAAAIGVAAPASAQIPVTDAGSIFQQIEQVRQGVEVIKNGADQLNQAKQLYQDLNKMTDVSSIANKLKSDVLRSTDVSSDSLSGFSNGDLNVVGGLRGKAQEVYQDLMGRISPNATAAQRTAYEEAARRAAVSQGLASNVGDSVQNRRQGLEELRGRMNGMSSAAERADMSARLQLEQAQMMNDAMGLQAIELQRRARIDSNYERSKANNMSIAKKLQTAGGKN